MWGFRLWKGINERKELVDKLQSVFSQKTRDEWIKILVEADVPVAPVKTPEQALEDPQVIFRQMIQEIKGPSGESYPAGGLSGQVIRDPGRDPVAAAGTG